MTNRSEVSALTHPPTLYGGALSLDGPEMEGGHIGSKRGDGGYIRRSVRDDASAFSEDVLESLAQV